ncbi:MAG: hypothetical protein IPL95_09105 [Saprospiraceae bacterium]|nr:hypothetical protein [Saprospiraceae bacterium]
MLSKNVMLLALSIILVSYLLSGCYKDKTVVLDTGAEITRPVTFSGDVVPIFNKSCAVSGCHSAGGKSPDLTVTNAYNNLFSGNFINKGDAANSELIKWMTGKKSTPMPVSGINKDYNALVLAWIKQGAENN